MRKKMRVMSCLLCLVCFFLAAFPCEVVAENAQLHDVNDLSSITLALYPYVPDLDMMRELITYYWEGIEPDVELEFVDWDCYAPTDMQYIDIVMYDTVFLSWLVDNGLIQPIEYEDIENADDIMDFVLDGGLYQGEVYGIPLLACSYFLFYEENDSEVAAVENFYELHEVVGGRKTDEMIPVDRSEGLMINYCDNIPFLYLDALTDVSGEHSNFEVAPDFDPANEQALDAIGKIVAMAGEGQLDWFDYGSYEDGTFQKATWFAEGKGRVHYGYSEDMAFMQEHIDEITMKPIGFAEGENIPLYFTDATSINSLIQSKEKKELCLKLMNLIASEEFLYDLSLGNGEPQYILPVRESLYPRLAEHYPFYEYLGVLVTDDRNRLYRFGAEIFEYEAEVYSRLLNE